MTRREWLSTTSGIGAAAIGGKLAAAKQNAPRVKITAVEPLVLHERSDPATRPWVGTAEVGNDSGILETYQMAVLADSYGVRMAPHGWVGPVAVRAATHVCAVIPNLMVQEFPGSARPRLDAGVDRSSRRSA